MVVEINSADEFNEKVLHGQGVIVVDFWATWCGPCLRFAPTFEKMAGEIPTVNFYKLDVDKVAEVTEEQGINCMPTFKVYKDGECIGSIEGASEGKLRDMIANVNK